MEQMQKRKKTAKIFLLVGIITLLLSMIVVSLVQTSGGRVTIKEISHETALGATLSGWLFVPDGVSAENPAPAIITSHGMFNNRGMQDLNFVELSRRGYVVFAMDMFSHGESQPVVATPLVLQTMNQAVEMVSNIGYVDNSRIGVTGHSLGGMNSNVAVGIDNMRETPLIAAVLINSANAEWRVDGEFMNIYGSRHVGIIAPQYEEFFMLDVDAAGNVTSPRDFIRHNNAQSFLHFGQDPSGLEQRSAETMYRQIVDGKEAIRVIYNPAIIHPWAHFSSQATYATIEFFEAALGAPNPIAPSNQVWQWKAFFNLLGLVGIAIFLVNFVILMVFTPAFESLRAKAYVEPLKAKTGGKIWFFVSLAVGALFGTLIYLPILSATDAFRHTTDSFLQTQTFGISLWALLCGLFTLVSLTIYYFTYAKKNGITLKDLGVSMNAVNCGKTLLLALISLTVFFGWVFFADYFFKADFRIWTIALRAFSSTRAIYAIFPYMLFFIVFFVANSLSLSSVNYNNIGGKKWVNTLIVVAFNVFPAAILILFQYITFASTGFLFFGDHAAGAQGPYHMFVIWLFPFILLLPATAIMARKIYRMTNNPYLPGIINAVIVTMMAAGNTLTWS